MVCGETWGIHSGAGVPGACAASVVGAVALPSAPQGSKCTTVGCTKETCDGGLWEGLIPPQRTELMQLQTELTVSEPWQCCKERQKCSFMVAAREQARDWALNHNQLSMVLTSLSTQLVTESLVAASSCPLEGLDLEDK